MRYRILSQEGDYVFGSSGPEFLVDSPQAVAQAIQTRLLLWEGEWFLDTSDGTPYQQRILGYNPTPGDRDVAIKERILGTPGVNSILQYQSSIDGRAMTVNATVDTIYGPTPIVVAIAEPSA